MSSAFLVTLWSENAERAGRHLADWYPHSADKEMAERVGAHSQPQGRWPEGPRRPRSPPTVCRHPPGAMLQAGRAGHSQGCGRALLRAAWGCRRLVGGVAWASGGGRALPWLGVCDEAVFFLPEGSGDASPECPADSPLCLGQALHSQMRELTCLDSDTEAPHSGRPGAMRAGGAGPVWAGGAAGASTAPSTL